MTFPLLCGIIRLINRTSTAVLTVSQKDTRTASLLRLARVFLFISSLLMDVKRRYFIMEMTNTNTVEEKQVTTQPEENGEKTFTQEDVNRITCFKHVKVC